MRNMCLKYQNIVLQFHRETSRKRGILQRKSSTPCVMQRKVPSLLVCNRQPIALMRVFPKAILSHHQASLRCAENVLRQCEAWW